jgi:hypothetical protein
MAKTTKKVAKWPFALAEKLAGWGAQVMIDDVNPLANSDVAAGIVVEKVDVT